MIEGLDGDDRWVQVEDEFLTTAKLFTQHLHHAEYQRLKRQARSKNASAIHRISRPVDSTTKLSTESRIKIQGAEQRHNQKNTLTNIIGAANLGRRDESDSEDEDPFMNDPRLAGLMTHRDSSTKLSTVAGVKAKTRASEGYSQTAKVTGLAAVPESNSRSLLNLSRSSNIGEVEDGSDYVSDDLDEAAVTAPYTTVYAEASVPTRYQTVSRQHSFPLPRIGHSDESSIALGNPEHSDPSLKQSPAKQSTKTSNFNIQTSSSDLSFDAFPRRQASSYSERMAKRKAEAAKKEKQEARRKSEQLDEIPTFLI
jgi:hypothetical protein